jgi:hypothetical protein
MKLRVNDYSLTRGVLTTNKILLWYSDSIRHTITYWLTSVVSSIVRCCSLHSREEHNTSVFLVAILELVEMICVVGE